MKHSSIIFTLFIFLICSNSFGQDFIKKHKSKKVSLASITDSIKIGYETDSAIVYFGKNEIEKTIKSVLGSGKLEPRWDYRTIDNLKNNLKFLKTIQNDMVVNHWQNQTDSIDIDLYDFAGFIDQWIFKDYLFDNKAEVWNKRDDKFERIVFYNFIEDRLGGEQCYYTFEDKTIFHRQIIALGE
ncbi:hypothetical protein [Carboxylicivirga marina]|uniref:hypothetical protein n=1 Tax=Carboxylicivirga marina TaxID=2800988 RepID=UPI002593F4B0|nr:hypothetical protein [uncultured Carboxylicivirga sp.]